MPPSGSLEARHQVEVRTANEAAVAAAGHAYTASTGTISLRCECGDAACEAVVATSRSEYEGVRALGTRFLIMDTHENPEISLVISANARFAVVETVGREARRIALHGNPRAGRAPA